MLDNEIGLNILIWPDNYLSTPCEDVIEFDVELKELVKKMEKLLKIAGGIGIGLSANQVGINKNLFIALIKEIEKNKEGKEVQKEKLVTFINPKIIQSVGPTIKTIEGCLSLPGISVPIKVRKPDITISAFDLDGMPFQKRYTNANAVCIAHELQHLEGKTLLDYTKGIKRKIYKNKLKKFKEKLERR